MLNFPKELPLYFWIFVCNRCLKYKNKCYFCLINDAERIIKRMKESKKSKSWRILGLTTYQFVILLVLIAMLFFFSDSSILKRMKYENEIKNLEAQIEYYRNQTEIDKEKLNELQSNKDNLEKFARENYLMKKENEEIFIIE